MRRMDRNGWSREHSIQGIINKRLSDDPRCKPDERGWVQPFAVCQGWEEWNCAAYALRCVIRWQSINRIWLAEPPGFVIRKDGTVDRDALHRIMDIARIESDLRTFHFALARSRRCDKPRLP